VKGLVNDVNELQEARSSGNPRAGLDRIGGSLWDLILGPRNYRCRPAAIRGKDQPVFQEYTPSLLSLGPYSLLVNLGSHWERLAHLVTSESLVHPGSVPSSRPSSYSSTYKLYPHNEKFVERLKGATRISLSYTLRIYE
jgi:hypothetical protein